MKMYHQPIPASFFGIVLGLVGLGDCWRVAAIVWHLPYWIGELIMLTAAIVWMILLVLYVIKWFRFRDEALAELRHPVQCCFIGLVGVATSLVAVAIALYSHPFAVILFVIGAILTVGFGIYRTGHLWMGDRDPITTTPVLYLPTVAGSFVSGFTAGYLGYHDIGILFFGAGVFSWFALESIITHRLHVHAELSKLLRPSLGIMLAPPVVGCINYLFITSGKPDLFAQALLGYGLLQYLLLLRLLPWITQQPFTASYWAFSFGVTAIAFDAIAFVQRGLTGYIESLAVLLFIAANSIIAILVLGTLGLLRRGKLLPPPLLA
jgi:tellurite resistance protein